MSHSDTYHIENTFGIHVNNKSISSSDHTMSANNYNSNAIMIGSIIATTTNSNSSMVLSAGLNTSKTNSAILTKTCSTSAATINANMLGQFTYTNSNNTAIKLVNLSKCQQIQNTIKENSNILQNGTINVQFVTPILNNSSNLINDCTSLSHSFSKNDSTCVSSASVVLTGSTNQTILTSSNSITYTRFTLNTSQAPILPHGSVTIIPQHSDIGGTSLLNTNLIKNARFTWTGSKPVSQSLRPITAYTTSTVSQSAIVTQPSISKISSSKPLSNYTISVSDSKYSNAIQDLTTNRQPSASKDQHLHVTKSAPLLKITSSNNIRLALTSNISNSKVNSNPSKIQLISPKSKIRSGSPVNIIKDVKPKDENIENPVCHNSQQTCYSPTRKRARKQHLKGVINKLQKLSSQSKTDTSSTFNNVLHNSTDKPLYTPISVVSTTISPVITTTPKIACITTQNKSEDSTTSTSLTSLSNNPQIIIPLKNPIHICSSKVQALASIYNGHLTSNNGIVNSTKTIGNGISQVQILSQTSQSRPVQLSSASQNLILSPTFGKSLTNMSTQKVIHIAPTKIANNYVHTVKNEKISLEPLNSISVAKEVIKPDNQDDAKLKISEIKSETSEDLHFKYSLFTNKYNWNARRTHFEKECDVKIKKSKTSSSFKQSNSVNKDDGNLSSDTEINDTSWCLYKASSQFLMQKCFDEENLRNFQKLKEKFEFHCPLKKDDYDEPIFQKVCPKSQCFHQLPDQIDVKSFTEYTDPDLFGISNDIIASHINAITTHNTSLQSQETTADQSPHHCSESCIYYLSEVPTVSQPPHILRIIDLIEGLIVKEKKIIEKESEINEQCLRLLENSEICPLFTNKNHSRIERVKTQNGRR